MNTQEDIKRLTNILYKMDNVYAQYAKSFGTNATALYLMYIVFSNDGCTQKQICEQMLLPKQTVNSIVSSFQKEGLLELKEMSEDRRQKSIYLTQKGMSFANRVFPNLDKAEAQSMEQLSSQEREMLFSLMEKYVVALSKSIDK